MTLRQLLKATVNRCRPSKSAAILFTGGLDSTTLALLTRHLDPLLVFGAIDAPECRDYNHRSITRSEKIARQLNLRFLAVNIGRRDYLRHLPTVCKILGGSISDLDLPAAAFLLAQLRSKSVRTVLSGMGSDEAFRLKRSQAARFPTRQIKQTLADHQALARHYGLAFRCPYLSSAVVRQIVEAAPGMKKNKSALVQIVAEQPALLALLKGRPAEHSSIPDNFWRPFSALHRYLQPTK